MCDILVANQQTVQSGRKTVICNWGSCYQRHVYGLAILMKIMYEIGSRYG